MRRIVVWLLCVVLTLVGWVEPAHGDDDPMKELDALIDELDETEIKEAVERGRNSRARGPWAVTADGDRVAAGTNEGRIEIWTVPDPRPTSVLEGHPEFLVAGLQFDPEGDRLASLGHDGRVRFWDLSTGALTRELEKETASSRGRVVAISWSPDGRHMSHRRLERTDFLDPTTHEWRAQSLLGVADDVLFVGDGSQVLGVVADKISVYDLSPRLRANGEQATRLSIPNWEIQTYARRRVRGVEPSPGVMLGVLSVTATAHDASDAIVLAAKGMRKDEWKFKLFCREASSGAHRWELSLTSERIQVLQARHSKYITVLCDDELRCLAPKNGRKARRRKYDTNGPRPQILTPDGSIGFTATDEGQLVILPAISSRVPKPAPVEEDATDATEVDSD